MKKTARKGRWNGSKTKGPASQGQLGVVVARGRAAPQVMRPGDGWKWALLAAGAALIMLAWRALQ